MDKNEKHVPTEEPGVRVPIDDDLPDEEGDAGVDGAEYDADIHADTHTEDDVVQGSAD